MGINGLVNAYDNLLDSRKSVEHPMLGRFVFKLASLDDQFSRVDPASWPGIKLQFKAAGLAVTTFSAWGAKALTDPGMLDVLMAIPSGPAELFAKRLADRTGSINVPEVRLHDTRPDEVTGFLKERSGVWVESVVVKAALPIYYLLPGELTPLDARVFRAGISKMLATLDRSFRVLFINSLHKPTAVRRIEYDFPAESENDPLIAAASMWCSRERLAILAFRCFGNISYPHSSNVLCDRWANLYSLDHEKFVFAENHNDIVDLWDSIRSSPRCVRVCQLISKLEPADIRESLQGIPDRYWRAERAVFSDPESASTYFVNRLNLWKRLFGNVRAESRVA